MKNCTDCKYAEWDKTVSGSLHPGWYGRCTYEYDLPPLPGNMFWIDGEPEPGRTRIARHRELKTHCPYYVAK